MRYVTVQIDRTGAGRSRPRRAFSLLELLVVMAVIAVCFALILSAVQRVRSASARLACANNLKQLGLALHNYHDVHGAFPPGIANRDRGLQYSYLSWHARLLPYIEQSSLWSQVEAAFRQESFPFTQPPHQVAGVVIPTFICPSDDRGLTPYRIFNRQVAVTSYLGNGGLNLRSADGVLYLNSRVRLLGITDGTSMTLLIGERPPSADLRFGWWYAGQGQRRTGSADSFLGAQELNRLRAPYDQCPAGPYSFQPGRVENDCDAFHFWSLHSAGAQFVYADASVHFLGYDAGSVLPALATRAGGEVFSPP